MLRLPGLTGADQRITEDVEKFSFAIADLYGYTFKPLLDVLLFTRSLSRIMGYKGQARPRLNPKPGTPLPNPYIMEPPSGLGAQLRSERSPNPSARSLRAGRAVPLLPGNRVRAARHEPAAGADDVAGGRPHRSLSLGAPGSA